MEIDASFGDWLRRRRKVLDLTQADLADRTGCSVSAIRKIEADERRPSREIAELLADVLKIEAKDRTAFVQVARGERRIDQLANLNLPPIAPARQATVPTPAHTTVAPPPKPALRPQLPVPATPLIGREAELAELNHLLALPECRLITLVGLGGIGKTRLATQVGHTQIKAFADGVYFISFAPVAAIDFWASAIGEAVSFIFSKGADPKAQLLHHLQDKTMLLILDNIEHLLDGVEFLTELLAAAPGLKLLVTSRERLNLKVEWVFELQGLPVPVVDHNIGREQFSAVALFLQSASRVDRKFQLTPDIAPEIVRICQLVGGLPLGIELAAAWVQVLPCAEIRQEIERNLDFLATTMRDVAPRHRDLRAVFEYSWKALTPSEQVAFQQLAVFADSFTAEAADAVAGVKYIDLLSLINKSLLQPLNEKLGAASSAPLQRRYQIHQALYQYANEKLAAASVTQHELRNRHCAYYSHFVYMQEKQLKSSRVAQALAAIGAEIENIRASWRHAVSHLWIDCLEQSVQGMMRFYLLHGPLQEAQMAIDTIMDKISALVAESGQARPQVQRFLGKLMAVKAEFLNERGLYDQAITAAQNAIQLAQNNQAIEDEAIGYIQWGSALHWQGNYAEAQQKLQNALRLAEQADLLTLQADSHRFLGRAAIFQSDYLRARHHLEVAVDIYHTVGDLLSELRAYQNLGMVDLFAGNYQNAKYYYELCKQSYREIGDRSALGFALNSVGSVCLHLGDYTKAKANYEESLAIKQQTGDRPGEGLVLANLGLLWLHLGDPTQALACSEQAVTISRALGERDTLAYAETCLAQALAATGQFARAAATYAGALTLRKTLGQTSQALEPLAGLAEVAWQQGDFPGAQRYVEEILAQLGPQTFAGIVELMRIYLICYRVLRTTDNPRARDVLQLAHQILQARAAKIQDEDLRCSYLKNVAAHRAIMTAHQEAMNV